MTLAEAVRHWRRRSDNPLLVRDGLRRRILPTAILLLLSLAIPAACWWMLNRPGGRGGWILMTLLVVTLWSLLMPPLAMLWLRSRRYTPEIVAELSLTRLTRGEVTFGFLFPPARGVAVALALSLVVPVFLLNPSKARFFFSLLMVGMWTVGSIIAVRYASLATRQPVRGILMTLTHGFWSMCGVVGFFVCMAVMVDSLTNNGQHAAEVAGIVAVVLLPVLLILMLRQSLAGQEDQVFAFLGEGEGSEGEVDARQETGLPRLLLGSLRNIVVVGTIVGLFGLLALQPARVPPQNLVPALFLIFPALLGCLLGKWFTIDRRRPGLSCILHGISLGLPGLLFTMIITGRVPRYEGIVELVFVGIALVVIHATLVCLWQTVKRPRWVIAAVLICGVYLTMAEMNRSQMWMTGLRTFDQWQRVVYIGAASVMALVVLPPALGKMRAQEDALQDEETPT